MTARFSIALVLIASAAVADRASQEQAVKKMEQFTNALCQCKAGDAQCAERILEDMKKFSDELAKQAGKDDKPNPDLAKRMEPVIERMAKCMTAAMTPKTGGKAPDPNAIPRPTNELAAYAKKLNGTWRCTGKRMDPGNPGSWLDAKITMTSKLSRDLDDTWMQTTQTMPLDAKNTMKSVVLTTHEAGSATWTRLGASNTLGANTMTSKSIGADKLVWDGDISQGGARHPMRVTEDLTDPKSLAMKGEIDVGGKWMTAYDITCKR